MRYTAKETAAKHDRIVREASRLFREKGFENVTVGEVMQAAGLTHGAFYAHFESRQDLEKAAIAWGQALSAGLARKYGATKKGGRSFVSEYLSSRHRDNPGDGCTMAALAQEVARSTPEIRAAFEPGVEEIFRNAALLGGVVLARAVEDNALSDEILEAVRRKVG
jgi:TetR/AcrR family transcriptional regulator, transcriptional repressor for nem operon